jgi:hypothetical protein
MSEQKFGIENLKKAVRFAIDLGLQIEKSGKDGFTWSDSFSFIDELLQIPGLLKSGDAILAELRELSAEERQELYAYAVAEFDIENDKVEDVVESALGVGLSVLTLVDAIRALNAPPVVDEPPVEPV